jgi:acyl carrier protein
VLDRLRVLYADALEYPADVFTEDADLEADLGIDSLKQTSLLARVAGEFGLPGRPAEMRVWDYSTLGRLADHIVASQPKVSMSR